MSDENLKAKELCTAGMKEDPLYGCQDASSRASGSRAKRACHGCFVTSSFGGGYSTPRISSVSTIRGYRKKAFRRYRIFSSKVVAIL